MTRRYAAGIALLILLGGTIPVLGEASKDKAAEIARVAIIKYEDKTGTKNFGYMPGSLQEAITKSMHTKFEFVEIDPETVEPSVAELRAKNKGIIDPKIAADICRKTNTDILIYGNFTFNSEEKEIEIQTYISLGSTDKFRTLKPVENRVDATIFQAADRVAADIVAEITKVAIEQQHAKGEAENKNQKGKTQLAKTEKSKTWADINWTIAAYFGISRGLVKPTNGSVDPKEALGVEVFRRFSGGLHLGVLSGVSTVATNYSQSNASIVSKFTTIDFALLAGYFFDLSNRWRLTTAVGGGYYLGFYNSYQNCSGNCSGGYAGEDFKMRNPMAMARTGIHFLIFSFMALGLEAEWRYHYDSPKSIHSLGAQLALSVVF